MPSSPLFELAAWGAASLACLYLAFHNWRLATSVADTARARVRSAPHGYLELYGRAEQGSPAAPVVAPLSGRHCVWWRYRVEQRNRRNWLCNSRAVSEAAFVLRDETGACQIDPRGASVKPSRREVWYGSEPWPSIGPRGGLGPIGSAYRYVEETILEYDGVCVLGEFAAVGGVADGDVSLEVSALLHDWKQDSATLLKRFDRDGDGQLNDSEWEAARSAARSEVLARQAAAPVVKQMAKPADGRPYVMAAREPRRLAQIYRWQAAACLGGFFVAVGVLLHTYRPG